MKIKVGDLVVVNKLDDATVYTVDVVSGFNVKLSYPLRDGTRVNGQWIDKSCCRKPTKAQLANIQMKVSDEHNRT